MTDDTTWIGDVRQCWAGLSAEIEEKYAELWRTPELPNMEHRSSALLCDWLEAHGFDVERGAHDIATAFVARKGTGGPTVAILAEYDALPGLSNVAEAERRPNGQNAGHACGHNHIGPTNTGAAIAAAKILAQSEADGTIVLIGCPAEEILWGKVALLNRGAFERVDAILTSHGDYQNGAISRPCQSVINTEMVFEGRAGHGGAGNDHNALDAAELAVQRATEIRHEQFPDARLQHVIRTGGIMPSITPDEVRLWLTTRHGDYDRARSLCDAVIEACHGTALQLGVLAREQFISESRGYFPNDTLARHLLSAMEQVGPPDWSEKALDSMARLSEAAGAGGGVTLDRTLTLHDDGVDPYGQDDGEVSWRIPLGRVNWAYPEEVPLHNWAMTAWSGMPESNAGPLMVSEALAIAAVGLCTNPGIISDAKVEHTRRLGGELPSAPRLGAVETMRRAPDSFWDATWCEPR